MSTLIDSFWYAIAYDNLFFGEVILISPLVILFILIIIKWIIDFLKGR